MLHAPFNFAFFFFNDTATTEIYTLSLHDALPICGSPECSGSRSRSEAKGTGFESGSRRGPKGCRRDPLSKPDRKSTRLNSSHVRISYAVFCLKKKIE